MRESVLNDRGQTTIPKTVRDALGLKKGDKIRYFLIGNDVRITKVRSIKELEGILAKPRQKALTLEEMDDAIAEGACESLGIRR